MRYTRGMTSDTIPGLQESIAPVLADKSKTDPVQAPGEDIRSSTLTTTEPVLRLPGWATKLAGGLATLAGAAYGFLPHPWSAVAGIVALVAAFLAMLPSPAINFSKPLIPVTLVPLALTGAQALGLWALSLTNPLLQSLAMLGAAVLSALAGKAVPSRVTTR